MDQVRAKMSSEEQKILHEKRQEELMLVRDL